MLHTSLEPHFDCYYELNLKGSLSFQVYYHSPELRNSDCIILYSLRSSRPFLLRSLTHLVVPLVEASDRSLMTLGARLRNLVWRDIVVIARAVEREVQCGRRRKLSGLNLNILQAVDRVSRRQADLLEDLLVVRCWTCQ